MSEPYTVNDKSYFELKEWGSKLYPIAKRKRGTSKIDECPFCGEKHTHGLGDGHRLAHCTGHYFEKIIINGNEIKQERGYFIEEY